MQCPECHRAVQFVTLCDFCQNSYCHSCDPQLSSNNNRLCHYCIALQANVRVAEGQKTSKLRKKVKRLPAPKLIAGMVGFFELRCVATKLVNRAARNKVTPGTSKVVDKLWMEARRTLTKINSDSLDNTDRNRKA